MWSGSVSREGSLIEGQLEFSGPVTSPCGVTVLLRRLSTLWHVRGQDLEESQELIQHSPGLGERSR